MRKTTSHSHEPSALPFPPEMARIYRAEALGHVFGGRTCLEGEGVDAPRHSTLGLLLAVSTATALAIGWLATVRVPGFEVVPAMIAASAERGDEACVCTTEPSRPCEEMEARAEIASPVARQISAGTRARVVPDAGHGETIDGVVSFVGPPPLGEIDGPRAVAIELHGGPRCEVRSGSARLELHIGDRPLLWPPEHHGAAEGEP